MMRLKANVCFMVTQICFFKISATGRSHTWTGNKGRNVSFCFLLFEQTASMWGSSGKHHVCDNQRCRPTSLLCIRQMYRYGHKGSPRWERILKLFFTTRRNALISDLKWCYWAVCPAEGSPLLTVTTNKCLLFSAQMFGIQFFKCDILHPPRPQQLSKALLYFLGRKTMLIKT